MSENLTQPKRGVGKLTQLKSYEYWNQNHYKYFMKLSPRYIFYENLKLVWLCLSSTLSLFLISQIKNYIFVKSFNIHY